MRGVRGRLLVAPLVLLVAGCGGSGNKAAPSSTVASPPPPPPPAANTPLHASFRALTHRPRVNAPWRYVVGASPNDANGTPIHTLVHLRVRVNGVWDDFGSNTFVGAYQDVVKWPPAARGRRLIYEVTVQQGSRSKTFRYWLRPR
jgi:hypothetical protein